MRHIVSFRRLWAWIAMWIIIDLVFMAIGPDALPEWMCNMASHENLAKDFSTAYFILGVWCFARESTAQSEDASRKKGE